jgi:hypothetical protein
MDIEGLRSALLEQWGELWAPADFGGGGTKNDYNFLFPGLRGAAVRASSSCPLPPPPALSHLLHLLHPFRLHLCLHLRLPLPRGSAPSRG